MVDFGAFSALIRGTAEAEMSNRDGRLFVSCGKRRGVLPIQNEEQPRPLKADKGVILVATDAEWLCNNIPHVLLSDLDRTGVLSAECDGREWRLSCVDDCPRRMRVWLWKIKGRIFVNPLRCKSTCPLIRLVNGDVLLGYAESFLTVRSGPYLAAIPSIEGKAQTRERVESGNKVVAECGAVELQDALKALALVAMAKDATPITVKLQGKSIQFSVTSSAGSVQSEIAAKTGPALEFGVSHALLSVLAAKAYDTVTLLVRVEDKEVIRITLQCNDLNLMMLTSL